MSGLYKTIPWLFTAFMFLSYGCSQRDSRNTQGGSLPRSPSASRTLDLGFSPLTSAGLLATAICEDKRLVNELELLGWSLLCTPVATGFEIYSGIEEGWLDVGAIDEQAASIACSSGVLTMISLADQSYKSLITASPAMVHEIRNMHIGYPRSSISPSSFSKQMELWNLDLKHAHLEAHSLVDLPSLLQRKRIDAMVSWEPLSSLAMEEHPEWHYLVRNIGTTYWAAHPLLRQDTAVTLALLRSQARQLRYLHKADFRFSIESRRWDYATLLGFPVLPPKSIKMLSERPTPLAFCPSSFIARSNELIPRSCVDSILYNRALLQVQKEFIP